MWLDSENFSFELILAAGRACSLDSPAFIEDRTAWSRIFQRFERWKLSPLLVESLCSAAWKDGLPEATRLRLEELRARTLIRLSGARAELERILRDLARARVDVLPLEQTSAHFQHGLAARSEEGLIQLAVQDLDPCLLTLGRRGYRGVKGASSHAESLVLRHHHSILDVRIFPRLDERVWSAAQFGRLWGHPVRILGQPEMTEWIRNRVLGQADLTLSPRTLVLLAQLEPQARELKLIADTNYRMAWQSDSPGSASQGWLEGISKLFSAWTRSTHTS